MLIDTDIIIWYMRGKAKARDFILSHSGFSLSVVSYMELVQGMRNKQELRAVRKALKAWNSKIVYIDHDISSKAMFYVEQHYLSHDVELANALIAATAVSTGLPLTTGNYKHYKMIKELAVLKFNPE